MALNVIERPGRPKVRTTPFPKVDVVTRTFLQERYNSERWVQMVSEPVRRVRPFWLFDSILDDRTTQTCRLCNGVLLPWDHQWWKSHKPPLHWGCRSIIRAVSRRTGTRRGITEVLPVTDVRHPFGTPPGKRARSFTPDKKSRKNGKRVAPKKPERPVIPPAPPKPPIVDKSKFDARLIAAAEKKAQLERKLDARVEGIKKLQSLGITNVHLLSDDIDPNEVYKLLKGQGADVIFKDKPLENLVLGARGGEGWKSYSNHGPINEIQNSAGGLFSEANRHGASYLKIGTGIKNDSPGDWKVKAANRKSLGYPELRALDANTFLVDAPDGRKLDQTITHEFGHAIQMHQGRHGMVNFAIDRRFNDPDREAVSGYGESESDEYFAECYSAYRLRGAEMKQKLPLAYEMVQEVLRLRGLPL